MDNLSFLLGLNANNGGGTGSTPSWSDVTDKPFSTIGAGLTTTAGVLQESVPLYTETETTTTTYGPGMMITGWEQLTTAEDSDAYFNMPNNATLTLDTSATYTAIASIDGEIISNTWSAAPEEYHTYGGYTWGSHEFYIDAANGEYDYRAHIYRNGQTAHPVDWLIIVPPEGDTSLEAQLESAGDNVEWGSETETTTVTTVHKLPNEYIEGITWDKVSNKPSIEKGTHSQSIIAGVVDTNSAVGPYSFVEGFSNTATVAATAAHVEGEHNRAERTGVHIEGSNNTASGYFSHAEGFHTKAASQYQHVQGMYNVENPSNSTVHFADIIGNGDYHDDTYYYSNAEATDWDGNKYLAGNVYTHVTNWATPTLGADKLATEDYVNTAVNALNDLVPVVVKLVLRDVEGTKYLNAEDGGDYWNIADENVNLVVARIWEDFGTNDFYSAYRYKVDNDSLCIKFRSGDDELVLYEDGSWEWANESSAGLTDNASWLDPYEEP